MNISSEGTGAESVLSTRPEQEPGQLDGPQLDGGCRNTGMVVNLNACVNKSMMHIYVKAQKKPK